MVRQTGTGLLALHGIGPCGAARLLVEVGDNVRRRLSRGGNRQIDMALHMMAVVQLRNPTEGRGITTGRPPGSLLTQKGAR